MSSKKGSLPSNNPLLVFGRDPRLLQTRRWILEKAGFNVETATEPEEAERIVSQRDVELFILCHSLSSDDCKAVLAAAHAQRPMPKVIVLTAGGGPCVDNPHDRILNAFDGPDALLAAVATALGATARPPVLS